MARIIGKGYSFDDVLIVPKYNKINSRRDVEFKTKVTRNYEIDIPLLVANMDTICESKMAIVIGKLGGLGVIHRFMTIKEQATQIKQIKSQKLIAAAAIGLKDYEERAKELEKAGVNILVLDIAHGHSKRAGKALDYLKLNYPKIDVMAGNIATKDSAEYFLSKGADAIKVGIGPGCLKEGTRILLANGTYKNIEEIKRGDKVINMNGKPVEVLKSFCTGIREVQKIKNNSFYEDTYATPEHQFFVGDLNSNSVNSFNSKGYKNILEKENKKGESKYKWKEIQFLKKDALLMPKKINFELNKDFNVILKKRIAGNKKENFVYAEEYAFKPNYEVGYLFGTFLGDGHASIANYKKSTRGSVHWYFGINEIEIANKLKKIIFNLFKKECKLEIKKKITQLTFYYKPLADFLINFRKKNEKHLPAQYLVENKEYLEGIFAGLIDSDGHRDKDGRTCFTNTSPKLIELFNILNYQLYGYFPNNLKHKKSKGNLFNMNIKNIKQGYRARTLGLPEKRLTKDYQIIKLIKNEEFSKKVKVYDLEVDCPTHSFIANNMIVHNSMCTTRVMTGAGVPQITAIMDAYEATQGRIPICADGGIRYPGDAVKAIGAGANTVMSGGIFAGCLETPGQIIKKGKKYLKLYRGMASYDATLKKMNLDYGERKEIISIEGEKTLVECQGSIEKVVKKYLGGLASGMTYIGADKMEKIIGKVDFMEISSHGLNESIAHGVRKNENNTPQAD